MRRSGVEYRHQVTDESNSYLGARAAEAALADSGLKLQDIDLLISASASFDCPLPSQACMIKYEMAGGKDHHLPAVDVGATCLSFVTAFEFAARMLDGDEIKNILIVTAESSSVGVNPANWETATLFGDAGVAAVVTYAPEDESCFVKGLTKNFAEGANYAMIEGGGARYHPRFTPYDPVIHSFRMDGKSLLHIAAREIGPYIEEFFSDTKEMLEDVTAIIPHQTSKSGMILFQRLLPFREGQLRLSLARYGNCIAASIPLTFMDEVEAGRIKRGDLCLLCGTAAGFSIGGILIKY